MEKFNDILKDFVDEKGLSLRKLSEESGVSAMQYSRYLKGSYPTVDVAVRLAAYFDCTLDYLFGVTLENQKCNKKTYDLSIFVERYLKVLKENNLSHWKFAKLYGISESNLRHWKNGDTPKVETLEIIARELSTSIDFLVGRTKK